MNYADKSAFPFDGNVGLTLREYFAIHAPAPTADEIEWNLKKDMDRNPHNDPYKAIRRTKLEIIADLRFAFADAMLAWSQGKPVKG